VENKPAPGNVARSSCEAARDGYTILLSQHARDQREHVSKLPYDPFKDFDR